MADIKGLTLTVVQQLKKEARDEMVKESKKKWIAELKAKMRAYQQAKQLVKNCERDIEDLEMRINDELA